MAVGNGPDYANFYAKFCTLFFVKNCFVKTELLTFYIPFYKGVTLFEMGSLSFTSHWKMFIWTNE